MIPSEIGMIGFANDGTYVRSPHRHLRQQAESAFIRLIEWYQFTLAPALPDGPVMPWPRP